MVIALVLTLDVDPFYIIADTDNKFRCNEDKIKAFLNQFGYDDVLEELHGPTKQEVLAFVNSLLDGLVNVSIDTIEGLSNEELGILTGINHFWASIQFEFSSFFYVKKR